MPLSCPLTAELRNTLYPLNPDQSPLERALYEKERYAYLKAGEGERLQVYKDGPHGQGKATIGIGFNLERPEARAEWEALFQGQISFQEILKGKRTLTPQESLRLFQFSMGRREKELKALYKTLWPFLRANERLAVEDAYFNCPALVRPGTRFYAYLQHHIQEHPKTKDFAFLRQAVSEIREKSNPTRDPGLQNRRHSQAELLASYKVLL